MHRNTWRVVATMFATWRRAPLPWSLHGIGWTLEHLGSLLMTGAVAWLEHRSTDPHRALKAWIDIAGMGLVALLLMLWRAW